MLKSNNFKLFFSFLFFFFSIVAYSETEYENDIINPFENNQSIKTIDKRAYNSEEISKGFFYFRRWEIITFGAFPLMFLFTSLVYDVSKFAYFYAKGDSNASSYSPFTKASNRRTYNLSENLSILGFSLAVSNIVALIDHLILRKKIAEGYYQRPFKY